ncbi:DUF421 domain-containing protein [Caenimonas sp. SL110]|uniref:DUF421 domain-containing protein n=1 Tax=Caenimonas sp. SL110 TaxID=1450524 RepID=UPI000653B397|nr:YetF domain-containing protein [Caenimonas sp. SL110]
MPDISYLFAFSGNPWELVVRGTVMYWFLFLLLRFVLRRDMGSIGVADMLLLVLIADASQNAMAGGYESITEGCILVVTIAGWNWVIDALSFHFKPLRDLLEAKPIVMLQDGKMLRRNMRREMLTVDELMAKLREHGLEKIEDAKLVVMESDGEISVIKRDGTADGADAAPKRKVAG